MSETTGAMHPSAEGHAAMADAILMDLRGKKCGDFWAQTNENQRRSVRTRLGRQHLRYESETPPVLPGIRAPPIKPGDRCLPSNLQPHLRLLGTAGARLGQSGRIMLSTQVD